MAQRSISLKLPEAMANRLAALAKRRGVSQSEVIREALAATLAGRQAGGASALDLARDLAGSLEGPGDLSTNPAHMDGFGR